MATGQTLRTLLLPSIEAGGDEFPMNFYSPALLRALIHRSAWNRNSANFAFWGFSEVRGSQASMALCSSEESVDPTCKRDPRKEAPNAHHHRPVNSRCSNASCGRWAGFGAATILHRAAQATQRRCRLYLRSVGCGLRRAFRAHAYRRLGTMERGRGPYY